MTKPQRKIQPRTRSAGVRMVRDYGPATVQAVRAGIASGILSGPEAAVYRRMRPMKTRAASGLTGRRAAPEYGPALQGRDNARR